MDQPKLERMLRLMKYLSGNVDYTIEELGRKLDMSPRTVYRYIDTFKSAGFAVTKMYGDVYKLGKMPRGSLELDKLIYFSEEEAFLVNSLIDRLAPTNVLKANLKQKLSAIYKSTGIAEYASSRGSAALVEALGNAITGRKKARLTAYESGHSHSVRDRYVEPFAFSSDFIDVWAFDLEDSRNKTFRISRIGGEVVVEDEGWTCEALHHRQPMDIFRTTGDVPTHIVVALSSMAKSLLLEEYPLAEKFIRTENGRTLLETDVYRLQGAGRFVAGLMGETEVLEGDALKAYLADYGKKYFTDKLD